MILEELLNHFYENQDGLIQKVQPTEGGIQIQLLVADDANPKTYLIEFKDVYGFRFEHFRVSELEVAQEHPILLFANEVEAHLNYGSLPKDPLQLDYQVRLLHREYFENWVDESEVLLQDLPQIEAAPGVLAQGPLSFIKELQSKVAPLIESHLVIHNEDQRPMDYQVFFLDDNWVIYRDLIVVAVD